MAWRRVGKLAYAGSVEIRIDDAAALELRKVDPKQQLVFILMTQVPWSAFHPYRKAIRYLAYQVMTELN